MNKYQTQNTNTSMKKKIKKIPKSEFVVQP